MFVYLFLFIFYFLCHRVKGNPRTRSLAALSWQAELVCVQEELWGRKEGGGMFGGVVRLGTRKWGLGRSELRMMGGEMGVTMRGTYWWNWTSK